LALSQEPTPVVYLHPDGPPPVKAGQSGWEDAGVRGRGSIQEQQDRLLESLRLFFIHRFPIMMIWLTALLAVLVWLGMALTGKIPWPAFVVVVAFLTGCCEILRRVNSMLVRRDERRARRKPPKPLRRTRRGRLALWLVERGLVLVAIEGPIALYCFGSAAATGAYARAGTLLPAGVTIADFVLIGAAAWFGARVLDSLWTVLRAALTVALQRELDRGSHGWRAPMDVDSEGWP
jgi:FtsH-binding integral membrane protein